MKDIIILTLILGSIFALFGAALLSQPRWEHRLRELKAQGKGKCLNTIGLVAIIFFAIFIIVMFTIDENKTKLQVAPTPKENDNSIMAWAMSHDFVKQQLVAPSTAKFSSFEESYIEKTSPNKYKIIAFVDAQNKFGAMIRQPYSCVMVDITGNGKKWRIENSVLK